MTTKYPIILVHGIVLKDVLFIKSFGKIDKKLQERGFTVYKSKVDGFGTIENNAKELKDEILKIFQTENCDKINVIAHSKGGLDAKYMIQNLGMEESVASLTTLCTPHKGSPLASNILRAPTWILKIIAFFINFWYRIFGDKHPDSLAVCKQLAQSKKIEEETFFYSDKVYCQSYSSKMESSKDDFVMSIPLAFCHYYEKDEVSDGAVSASSAIFGEYKGDAFDQSVSHTEITDFLTKKKKKEKIYAFYYQLCEDLAARGF